MDLDQNESTELLKALHILTRDGKMNADSRRKLKQVHHLSQLIEPMLKSLVSRHSDFTLVDLGAGKSYLGFILYDLILKKLDLGQIVSVESRQELVEKSEALARASGFDRMKFIASAIETIQLSHPVHLVCALHACDTATDDAIQFGLRHHTQAFALVPCCQAEVSRLLGEIPKNNSASNNPLYHFPLHRREFGSHLTNVIRTLYLQSLGYKVTGTELVGWEHSMKNEMILAEKISDEHHPKSQEAKRELEQQLEQFPIRPKLMKEKA